MGLLLFLILFHTLAIMVHTAQGIGGEGISPLHRLFVPFGCFGERKVGITTVNGVIPTFLLCLILDVGSIGWLPAERVRNGGILSFIYRLSFS